MNTNLREQILSLTREQAEANARDNRDRALLRAQAVAAQRSAQPVAHRRAADWQVKR